MTGSVQRDDIQQQILGYSRQLDQIQWRLDDQIRDHPISTEFVSETKYAIWKCYSKYLKRVHPNIQLGADKDLFHRNLHFLEKHERLTFRIMRLVPVEPIIVHQQFIERSQYIQRSSHAPLVETASSTESNLGIDEPSSSLLNRISMLLRQGDGSEALQALNRLPSPLQKNVFDALWIVRGRPSLTDPIGHENFGEISFNDKEPRCASSSQQKACAIELVKLSSLLSDLIPLLRKNDLVLLRRNVELLPIHIQNEIFRKHWEQMGSPSSNSPKEFHRKIAHHDFGRVSFLGLVEKCDVFVAHKIKTIEAYLIDFNQKIVRAQALTDQIKNDWNQLDSEEVSAEKKVSLKKKNLHDLSREIVPLFEGKTISVEVDSDASYHALGMSYINSYPCLKPFFLQLMNNL